MREDAYDESSSWASQDMTAARWLPGRTQSYKTWSVGRGHDGQLVCQPSSVCTLVTLL
ncbi:hypothetical protein DPMN_097810 [Dreissena polymorpha]|uniref:Uncharacterized protein n=1 Tax=Dreissena polymorpha TaxID=45954 RepID=A0A9D4LAY7_DREPO|nr:hypothetical protein DPMN_097810 [Dreissena polymorpha]